MQTSSESNWPSTFQFVISLLIEGGIQLCFGGKSRQNSVFHTAMKFLTVYSIDRDITVPYKPSTNASTSTYHKQSKQHKLRPPMRHC